MLRRNFLKARFFIYVKLIRPWLSVILWYSVRIILYRKYPKDRWKEVKDLPVKEFSRYINSKYEYLDQFPLMDYSPREPNFFFIERTRARDCTHWSRLWYYWLKDKYYEPIEIAMYDLDPETKLGGHMVTATIINGKWEVFDYTPGRIPGNTLYEALLNNNIGMKDFTWYRYKELML